MDCYFIYCMQNPEIVPGLMVGDVISKINGQTTGHLTFNGKIAYEQIGRMMLDQSSLIYASMY